MSLPGQLGFGAPQDPITALVRRIEDLERTQRQMNSKLVDGGTLQVNDPTSNSRIFYVGPLGMNDGSGRMQGGFEVYRQDDTAALIMADLGTAPGHTIEQALQWFDRNGRTVVSDDTVSGHGLATPHIVTGGLVNSNTATWPATTNTSFTTIAFCWLEVQNPKLAWYIDLEADSGVTATFQLLVAGTQVGTTQTVAAATFSTWNATNQSLPGSVSVGQSVLVELQAKVSTSTGSARAQCLQLKGDQS